MVREGKERSRSLFGSVVTWKCCWGSAGYWLLRIRTVQLQGREFWLMMQTPELIRMHLCAPRKSVPSFSPSWLSLFVSDSSWQWQSISGTAAFPLVPPSLQELTKKYNLCITGEGLSQLQATDMQLLRRLIPHVQVFARVAPKQKVFIVCFSITVTLYPPSPHLLYFSQGFLFREVYMHTILQKMVVRAWLNILNGASKTDLV